ncbi:hypothetical protein [Acuticoccus sp.]|uniref:hypothetical protein n=1 Tax=Acuticoccus sp. TaxID=1904378 RepID=UPI003B52248C
MKLLIVGLWAVVVTLGAGYAAAAFKLQSGADDPKPKLEGLRYTSLPTMSVPVVEDGALAGYVVVRMVYTADAAVLRALAAEPDAFITDEIFRTIYGSAEVDFGQLARLDLAALADGAKARVNERMGDDVIQDLLVDGLNYVNLNAQGTAAQGPGGSPEAPSAPEAVRPTAAALH